MFCFGGSDGVGKQRAKLGSAPYDILVATPGRFVKLWELGDVHVSRVSTVVVDEVDTMLSQGFGADLEKILKGDKTSIWVRNVQLCLFSIPPLFAMSLWLEGWPAIVKGVTQADALTWAAVAWQAVGNTMFGYAAWGWLLARHPAARPAVHRLVLVSVGSLYPQLHARWWEAWRTLWWACFFRFRLLGGLARWALRSIASMDPRLFCLA